MNCQDARIPLLRRGGCAIKKCREATEAWRRRGGSPAKPCKQELWNHPACSAFLEFDGLAGTPPNLGGEFQTPNCQFIHTFYGAPVFRIDQIRRRRHPLEAA